MEETPKPQENNIESLARAYPMAIQAPGAQQTVTVRSGEASIGLLEYWHVIVKRRWVVITSLLIVFTTVMIATLKQKPVYEGDVLIEVSPEEPSVVNFKEVLRVDTQDVDSYRETQFRILTSRTLAERVITDSGLWRRPEFYRKRALFGLIERAPKDLPSTQALAPPGPRSEALRNAVKNFLDSLDVSPVRLSNLVQVSFYSTDPELAVSVANQLANDYIDQNLQVKWEETKKASEWLSGRLTEMQAKLEKSEDALQAYARANSILFVEEKQNLTNARLKLLQEEYTKAQADRFQKESLYRLVQAGRVQDLPGFLSNKLIQDLAVREAELERDYSQLLSTVKTDYPKAVALKRQIDSLKTALDQKEKALTQNIVDDYRSAVANEKYLADALNDQKKEVNDIGEKSIQYNILKRQADTNRQLYEGLLQRLREAQVSAGLKATNIRIVDLAQPGRPPVKPRVLLNLALGVFLGLSLGIGLAFLQEHLDDTIKTPDDVEVLLSLPSLGVVLHFDQDGARNGKAGSLLPTSTTNSPAGPGLVQIHPEVIESFRSLRTSMLLSANPVPKSILVSSALPGEGKTTITVNLAKTLASLGSRVVIVDGDMRRPSCHRVTGVANKPGFVYCLAGRATLDEVVLPVPDVANLSVIPCGPIPPNPSEILSSSWAKELFARLRQEFEFVLVDSPPLLSVSDGRILSTLTDAAILVVHACLTPRDAARRARSLLYASGARVLGVALNDVDLSRDGYGYRYGSGYHYYRYGYGYGYGKPNDGDSEGDGAEGSSEQA